MNSKSTWVWIVIMLGLAAFMLGESYLHTPPPAPPAIVSADFATNAASVLVRPAEKDEIRAESTNGPWQLTEPIRYPAQSGAIQILLARLAQLTPDTYITAGELRERPKASEEYGLTDPQFAVTLQQADNRRQLRFGARTAP